MRRRLIAVVGCLVCLAAGTVLGECPELVGTLPHVPHGYAGAVGVSGTLAFFNSGHVLHVVDVSAPSNPRLIGEVGLPGEIEGIAVDGSTAYIALGASGVCTVDFSDPSSPEERFCLDLRGSLDVAVFEGYLYVADGSAGLRVFDLENPEVPVEIGHRTPAVRAVAVSLTRSGACTYALVADPQRGLRVIDVSDPSWPVEVGHYYDSGILAFDVAVSGGYAFVADGWIGLRVIDVRTPSSPVEVAIHSAVMAYPASVSISGSIAYVGGDALVAIDVSVPWAPFVVGVGDNPGFATDTALTNQYVFAGDQQAGLAIFGMCRGGAVNFGSIECVEPPVPVESFIPAAAVARGAAGAFFQTDVEVSNTGEDEAEISFGWLPRGQDNPDPLVSADYVLAAGESRRFDNALSEIFDLGPDSMGALRLTSSSESVIGMSRTYNRPSSDNAGTYGQSLPAVPVAEMIPSGERRRIMFMSEDADSRANLGCVNGTDRPLQVSIGIHDSAGAELDVRSMSLGPYANKQINRVLQEWAPMQGYVDVWSDTEGALFYCYGSVLDNLTSDPTTVLPQ